MKKLQILLVLFAGVVFGSATTGCFALWLGVARADNGGSSGAIVTVPCSVQASFNGRSGTYAVASFPGLSTADILANVYVYYGPLLDSASIGGIKYRIAQSGVLVSLPEADLIDDPTNAVSGVLVADDSVALYCGQAASITLYVR